jgi:branched-chain amino acid transport system substrate-binding protein
VKSRSRTRVAAAAATLIAVVAMAACAGGAGSPSPSGAAGSPDLSGSPASLPPAAKGTAKIGLLAPITGETAADGEEMVRGATIAVDEINAAGGACGYNLELVIGDAVNLQADAVTSQIQRISADPDVNMILTGYASTDFFEVETLARQGMPYMVAGNPASTKAMVEKEPGLYDMFWNFAPSFDVYGPGFADWVESIIASGQFTPKNRSYYLVNSDNAYSNDIANSMVKAFDERGWTQVGKDVTPDSPINDWRSIVSKIKTAAPDLIINTDYKTGNEATFLDQFLQSPTNALLYLEYGPSVPEFLELTGDKSTGVSYALAGGPVDSLPGTQAIRQKFRDNYNVETGLYGIYLYEMIHLYADALTKVCDPTDRAAIGAALGEANKQIAMGQLIFDPATHLGVNAGPSGTDGQPFQIYQIWDGEYVEVAPEPYKTGDFQLPPWFK